MSNKPEKIEKFLKGIKMAFLRIVKVYKINTDFYQNRSSIHIAT